MPDAGRVAPISACVWGLSTLDCLHFTGQQYLHICKCNKHGSHPPHSTFCAICLHSALFVCTQLIFNALRSVCRGNIPTLLPTLPALLSALPTLLPTLPTLLPALPTLLSKLPTLPARVATKLNSIVDAFAGHRESRFSVAPTNFTPSLYPHSLPAQHIICLYMQDNADEVQVVQAV